MFPLALNDSFLKSSCLLMTLHETKVITFYSHLGPMHLGVGTEAPFFHQISRQGTDCIDDLKQRFVDIIAFLVDAMKQGSSTARFLSQVS
jgi:hypothetical protein